MCTNSNTTGACAINTSYTNLGRREYIEVDKQAVEDEPVLVVYGILFDHRNVSVTLKITENI